MPQSPLLDPRTRGATPPFNQSAIEPPGTEKQLSPMADHGEESYVGSGKLKGCKALITGGDSGIGRAVAIAFAREGADVAINYLSDEEDRDANETKRLVEEAGQRCVLLQGDITSEEFCKELVADTVESLGGLDILVNNAAFQRSFEDLTELPPDVLEKTFQTNVYAPFWLSQAAIPHLKPGSVILNTASINSYDPSPQLLAYAATKGAIANFTKGLSQMLVEKGIRVNAVAPGPVWTPLIPSTLPEEKAREFGKQVPLQRPAQPAELAPVYVLLASNDASYITGMVYGVTGGQLMA
jgi:NAD(P)-dependent dehydrogenase (short-subunit alcohol dehydrogenase family)